MPQGLLTARSAVVFNTSNTPADRETAVFKDPRESIWKDCIFGLCGVPDVYRETFSVVVTSSTQQRDQWLQRVARVISEYYPAD